MGNWAGGLGLVVIVTLGLEDGAVGLAVSNGSVGFVSTEFGMELWLSNAISTIAAPAELSPSTSTYLSVPFALKLNSLSLKSKFIPHHHHHHQNYGHTENHHLPNFVPFSKQLFSQG